MFNFFLTKLYVFAPWKGEKSNLEPKLGLDRESNAIFEISDAENPYFDALFDTFQFRLVLDHGIDLDHGINLDDRSIDLDDYSIDIDHIIDLDNHDIA